MQQLFIGLLLLGLAIGTVILFTVDVSSDSMDGFGGMEEFSTPTGDFTRDRDDVRITEGRDQPDSRQKNELDHLLDPTLHDGILTRREKRRLTGKGFLPYRLKEGDTLRKVAQLYLDDVEGVSDILEHNPKLLNERDIEVGQEILIPLWLRR